MKKYLIHVYEKHKTVLVKKSAEGFTVIDDAIADCEAEEISNWVRINGLGRRIAYDRWKFDSKDAISLFLLKWG